MKKTIIGFIVIMIFAISQAAFGFTFRGIEIGKSLDQQMPECNKKKDQNDKGVCYTNFTTRGYYSIDYLPDLGFVTGTDVKTIDGKVELITVTLYGLPDFSTEHFNNFFKLLTSKYGKYKSYSTETVQNRMGAKFKKINIQWKVDDCLIYLTNRAKDIENGLLIVQSEKYNKFEKSKKEKELKDAKDKL